MTDPEIIALYWDRNQAAIAQSAAIYGGYCYAIAHRILHNKEDAEECVNDTWLRAWTAIPPEKPRKLSLFFGCITRNLSFDRYKMQRAAKRGGGELMLVLHELEDCIPAASSVEQALAGKELERLVNDFLHRLPVQECNIFLLRYWHSLPLAEIGKRLSLRENNVKASLYRSRKKLRTFLEKEGVVL